MLFRQNPTEVSLGDLPVLGIGVPGTNPEFATIVIPPGVLSPWEQRERDPELARRRAHREDSLSALRSASARALKPPTVTVRYALAWGRDDLVLSTELHGEGTLACLFAVVETYSVPYSVPWDDPRCVEVFSSLPVELIGPTAVPDRLDGSVPRRELPGGSSGVALARWDLRLSVEPRSGWIVRVAASDSEDSLESVFRASGLTFRYAVIPPRRGNATQPKR
jgi:hypothetical protein